MKFYKKQYEDVFGSKRNLKKCDFTKVSSTDGLNYVAYGKQLRQRFKKFQKDIFDNLIKTEWLFRRFCYRGKTRNKKWSNGANMDAAFGVYIRSFVGYDNRMVSKDQFYTKIRSYFDEFFPEFNSDNPFKKKYRYPFKYMTLECLVVVYAIKERMELLKYCERKKMSYVKFLDYIINYIYSYNDDVGYHYYEWKFTFTYIPYVCINKEYRK